jgi:hypothetical protein
MLHTSDGLDVIGYWEILSVLTGIQPMASITYKYREAETESSAELRPCASSRGCFVDTQALLQPYKGSRGYEPK